MERIGKMQMVAHKRKIFENLCLASPNILELEVVKKKSIMFYQVVYMMVDNHCKS